MPTVSPPEHSAEDVQTLIARVAELERTQLDEDVEGFVALFDTDAVWITGGGIRLVGRDAIADFTRQVLPGAMHDGSVRYDVMHIAFIRPDVALTSVNQQYLTLDGQPKPGQAGRPSYVWSKTDGVWRIVTGQNTTVPEA
jgi:uncharacterized protein (TIGR02246 family)